MDVITLRHVMRAPYEDEYYNLEHYALWRDKSFKGKLRDRIRNGRVNVTLGILNDKFLERNYRNKYILRMICMKAHWYYSWVISDFCRKNRTRRSIDNEMKTLYYLHYMKKHGITYKWMKELIDDEVDKKYDS